MFSKIQQTIELARKTGFRDDTSCKDGGMEKVFIIVFNTFKQCFLKLFIQQQEAICF